MVRRTATTMSGRFAVLFLAALLGAAAFGPAAAQASTIGHRVVRDWDRPHGDALVTLEGTIASVGTSSFSLARGRYTVTVDVSGATTYRDPGVTNPSFANLAAGERVRVVAQRSATVGTFDALRVAILPFPVVTLEGTIASVGTSSFSLARGRYTVTVDVSGATTYRDPGVTNPSVANLAAGERGRVAAQRSATVGTFDALRVAILPFPVVTLEGTIASVGTSSFSLARGRDSATVDLSGATTYRDPGVTNPSFANLAAGERVRVVAQRSATVGTREAVV